MEKTDLEILKEFIERKQHYKSDLHEVFRFGREFELVKPGYLEVYHESFYNSKVYKDSVYMHGKRRIVGGEIGSQGRYRVDFISHDSRYNTLLYSVCVDEFIKMVLAGKIILLGE